MPVIHTATLPSPKQQSSQLPSASKASTPQTPETDRPFHAALQTAQQKQAAPAAAKPEPVKPAPVAAAAPATVSAKAASATKPPSPTRPQTAPEAEATAVEEPAAEASAEQERTAAVTEAASAAAVTEAPAGPAPAPRAAVDPAPVRAAGAIEQQIQPAKFVEAKKPAAATSVKNPDKTVTENTADRTEAVAVEEGSGETAAQSAQEVAPRPVAGPSPKPAAARRSAEQTHARPQVTEKTEPARAPQASVRETSAGRQLPQVVKVKGAESATDKKRPVAAQTTEPAPQAATPVALAVAVATPQPQPVATVAGTPAEAQKSDEQPKTAGAGRRQPAAGRQAHVASGQAPAAKGNAPANVALSHAPVARTAGKAAEEAATKEGSEAAVRTPIAPTPPTPPTAAAAVSAVAESATALPAAPVAPIVAAAAAAPVAQTAQAAFAAANHPPIVMGMRGQLLPDGGTMHIRLAPPELGELQVSVQVSAGAVAASFETSNDSATRLLSHTLGDLKTALETAGVTVARLQVSQAAPSTPRQGSDSASGRQKSSEDQAQPDGQTSARDQQRRELLRRMWRRVGGEPLDLVA